MKGNEGPKGQKLQNAAGLGADKICLSCGGDRTWQPRQAKTKEMKAQKAKMKGNEGPKGQNERK